MPEEIPVTDTIIELIEEVVASVSPSPPLDFGHGTDAYANLQGQDNKITGDVAWLFPVQIQDTIAAGGVMISKYTIILVIGVLSDLSNDADALKAELKLMSALSKKIILTLDDDKRVKDVTDIRREPIYFTRDLTITGYALSAVIELEHEAFDYCDV